MDTEPPASLNARVPPCALPGPGYLSCTVSEAASLEALESGLCPERLRRHQRRSSRAPGCATWPGSRPPSRLASHMGMLCFCFLRDWADCLLLLAHGSFDWIITTIK